MAFEYGKLDFSTSFNPTSAFPVDARMLFDNIDDARAAAASAEAPGSKNTKYFWGMKLLVVDGSRETWYKIQRDGTLAEESAGGTGGGTSFTTDETLTLEGGVLRVNTATEAEENNTLPITSAAVATTVGNIEILLQTI